MFLFIKKISPACYLHEILTALHVFFFCKNFEPWMYFKNEKSHPCRCCICSVILPLTVFAYHFGFSRKIYFSKILHHSNITASKGTL